MFVRLTSNEKAFKCYYIINKLIRISSVLILFTYFQKFEDAERAKKKQRKSTSSSSPAPNAVGSSGGKFSWLYLVSQTSTERLVIIKSSSKLSFYV